MSLNLQIVSDLFFNLGVVRGAEARRRKGWKLHLYRFDHFNRGWFKKVDAVTGKSRIAVSPSNRLHTSQRELLSR